MTENEQILHTWPIPVGSTQWQSRAPGCAREVDWLTDTGSLTAKLMAVSEGAFSVRVLRQGRLNGATGAPVPTGSRLRGIGRGLFWQREVLLCGHNAGWVRALTLVPARYQRLSRRLRQLGDRPLGAFLFAQTDLERLSMDYARLDWGLARRSWFRVGGQEIILVEVFLDEFLALMR